jgi:hypothetical protein
VVAAVDEQQACYLPDAGIVRKGNPLVTDPALPGTAGALSAILFDGTANFSSAWLHGVDGIVVPLASPAHIDRTLAQKLHAGAATAGMTAAVAGRLGEDHTNDELVWAPLTDGVALIENTWQDTDFVVALPDMSAALLVTTSGYSLLGGSPVFVRGATNGGVDSARAQFGRYAKKLGGVLLPIAAQYPPLHREWATEQDVEPGSGVADQLALMRSLVAGEISAQSFAPAWLTGWRRERNGGERTRGALNDALHDIFVVLEDYAADPSLREPDDMTDEELVAKVRKALDSLAG